MKENVPSQCPGTEPVYPQADVLKHEVEEGWPSSLPSAPPQPNNTQWLCTWDQFFIWTHEFWNKWEGKFAPTLKNMVKVNLSVIQAKP